MNILVIGSGAREHAIVWKCLQSELVHNVFCFPGNAGIAMIAEVPKIISEGEKVDLEGEKWFAKLADFTGKRLGSDGLTIVGPDNPLAAGIVDYFEDRGLLILGPTKQAALIESSKVFCKNFLTAHRIPTGSYKVFAFPEVAKEYVRKHEPPFVIKADGLALGKGVIIAKNAQEGYEAIDKLMGAPAGKLILIEEFLMGWECSVIVLTDGVDYILLPIVQDCKELNGRMTGGIGSYGSLNMMTPERIEEICAVIIEPVIFHMRESWRHPFKGFMYFGLMITKDGPKVLEINARLGDPEAQVILPRLQRPDFVRACYATAHWNLKSALVEI